MNIKTLVQGFAKHIRELKAPDFCWIEQGLQSNRSRNWSPADGGSGNAHRDLLCHDDIGLFVFQRIQNR
jgi:hypothetical protein